MEDFFTAPFWIAVGQIILIDILLGGDNAVVIALACRGCRRSSASWASSTARPGAIVLRVILIAFALALLAIPYLKVVGGLLLVWIGVKLLVPHEDEDHANIQTSDKLWGAVKTVIVADLVMSVDNVLAIAGAAESAGKHQLPLVIFGLLVSIPIIVAGSQIVLKLMDRFPIIITLGAHAAGLDRRADGVHRSRRQGLLPDAKAWEYAAAAAGALLVRAHRQGRPGAASVDAPECRPANVRAGDCNQKCSLCS